MSLEKETFFELTDIDSLKETINLIPENEKENYRVVLKKLTNRSWQQLKFYWIVIKCLCYFQKTNFGQDEMSEYIKENYCVFTNNKKYLKKWRLLNNRVSYYCSYSVKMVLLSHKEFCNYMDWIEAKVVVEKLGFYNFEDLMAKYNANAKPKKLLKIYDYKKRSKQ